MIFTKTFYKSGSYDLAKLKISKLVVLQWKMNEIG